MAEEDLPLVSVITPSLNQGRFIEETILSVKSQGYPRLEHLIIDGGSTDETLEILSRYDHLIWVSELDRGQADAVNKGFRLAKGEIIGWLNSDDTYAAGTVSTAVDYLLRHPDTDLVYGDCHVIDEAGTMLEVGRSRPYNFRKLLVLDDTIPQPTVFFHRRVVEKVGMLDPTLELAMDFNFWVRVGRECRIEYLPGMVARFRSHAAAKSNARARDFLREILFTLDRIFSDPHLPWSVARLRREAYSGAYLSGGIRSYNTGEWGEARRLLLKGLCYYPHPFRLKTMKGAILLMDTLVGSNLGKQLKDLWGCLDRMRL
jgi:glycosyltransferase involved in cell wall biosynthesis